VNVIETAALGRRYGAKWALRDCDLTIPEGRLVALIGPNGAGKSTLLNMIVGLTSPTTGDITVLGGHRAGSPAALDGIAFVSQEMPLYRNLSVVDLVHLTRNLNVTFDPKAATQRLAALGIDQRQKAGRLSGGQRAQVALSLALARHPRLLVLDEPTAPLDPLARHDFMAGVMQSMADEGISVVLSSHMVSELERVADHLVLVAEGRVRLTGDVGELIDSHRLLTCPTERPVGADWEVIETTSTATQTHRLVRLDARAVPADCDSRPVGLEELTLAYFRNGAASREPVLTGVTR
jgi:ABC-2 type transport system ATP-binding protein